MSASGAARSRAVVFAYHNVGARCLRVLVRHVDAVPHQHAQAARPDVVVGDDDGARTRRAARAHGCGRPSPVAPSRSSTARTV